MARRIGGGWRRSPSHWGAIGLLSAWLAVPLVAQVGYEPRHSPYHDMPSGGLGLVTAGYLGGSRGSLGVGNSNGPTAGVRYQVPLGVLAFALNLAYARPSRFVIDPTQPPLSRTTGPFKSGVVLADAGLQLVLTGKKTWRGFAPYVGGTLGLAVAANAPHDTSGYAFGTKFTFGPDAGVRWYPAGRVTVLADFRATAWRLSYPASYKQPDQAGDPTVLGTTASTTEWTWHPWIAIGLGWTF
ncbi:MAG TPA: hypothetical protein VEU55_01385 [Gemmatimonadales bacterium]|nr:hypothetical protein [Gemmatimonadales bacterium]